ncbi:hypothetical protein [Metabacillus sp. RGM 3146]|uniref:hypothetical protein n=1 Tax=Metabacillus sp. RGM 3146 TaxID=3401092 RepID=UPI003B9BE424
MKRVLLVFIIILAVGSVAAGKIYWEKKISAQASSATKTSTAAPPVQESEKNVFDEKNRLKSANNLPKETAAKFAKAIKEKKPLTFMVGSDTTEGTQKTWPALFKEELLKVYSDQVVKVDLELYKDKTTKDILTEKIDQKLSMKKPDILLIEPFILKDNGVVGISNTLSNTERILNSFKQENKDISIFIQPSYPMYKAKYYPKEVTKVAQFSKDQGIPFLNHWEKWPNDQSKEMLSFLNSNKSAPSEKGNQVWLQYLNHYFAGEN